MADAPQVFFNPYVANLHNGVFNIGTDTLKLALTNYDPLVTSEFFSSITEIAAGGGYTAGGFTLTVASSAQSSGAYKAVINDYLFEATGTVATFQYAVLYDNTPSAKPLICKYIYSTPVNMTNADQWLFDFDGTLGALRASFAA